MRHDDSLRHQEVEEQLDSSHPTEGEQRFISVNVSPDKLAEIGRALDRYLSILDEWAREDDI